MFTFAACDQAPIHVDNNNATTSQLGQTGGHVPIVDGRLAFSDMEAFENFMKTFTGSEVASLDELPVQGGFISLRTATKQLVDDMEETLEDVEEFEHLEMLEIVEDPYFSSVLNENGEIQIGSDVFKVTRNYVYRTPQSKVDFLEDIKLRNTDHTVILSRQSDSIETHEIERAGYAGAVGKAMVDRKCTSYFTSKRRIEGKSWITDYWLYASAGTRTKSERKVWWRWRSNTIDQVRIESDYSLTDSDGNTSEDDYDHSAYNSRQLETVFMTDGGWSATITGNIDTDHSGKRSGVWRNCNTVVSRSG